MTDKELQKLGRRDLLQLLLDQAQEAEQLRQELSAANERMGEMEETFQRLRERLNDKDGQMSEMEETYERLRKRLNDKDAQIQKLSESLQMEREDRISSFTEAGSIAEAALQLSGVFDAAQRAADLYLQKVRESNPLPDGVVMGDVVSDPAWPGEAKPAVSTVPPFGGRIVDIEPTVEKVGPPAAVITPLSAPPPPAARQAEEQPVPESKKKSEKRGLFRKKPRDRRKFVISFGWEEK